MPDISMLFSLLNIGSQNNFYGTSGVGYFFDSWYFILVIPALLLSLIAQGMVKSTFSKYSQVPARSGYTGQTAARRILDQNNLFNVRIEHVPGNLTDHYDPRTQVLRLSDSTFGSNSIAAIGVAAHEAGHAIQHDAGYVPNQIRSGLVPIARIGSTLGPYMALFGFFLGWAPLINLGILLFAGAVLFYIVTLPVEFNASNRAISILETQAILSGNELDGARKVLRAAAMTYIASTLVAFANLLRLILLARGRNDRNR
jgi:Zn-dependent membrane protease YugP